MKDVNKKLIKTQYSMAATNKQLKRKLLSTSQTWGRLSGVFTLRSLSPLSLLVDLYVSALYRIV